MDRSCSVFGGASPGSNTVLWAELSETSEWPPGWQV